MRQLLSRSRRPADRPVTPSPDPATMRVPVELGHGPVVDAAAIEAHYRVSAFIGDICVLGWPRGVDGRAERLYAVVVPDRDVLRAKRIVNAGEVVRFEMDGRAVLLPPRSECTPTGSP
jgi:hypothetical protein